MSPNATRTLVAAAALAAFLLSARPAAAVPAGDEETTLDSLVRITVTSRDYDYYAPWQALGSRTTEISGSLLPGNLLLTLARPLQNHIMVQVSKNGQKRQVPAEVVLKDYASNLALLKVTDEEFLADRRPVRLAAPGRPEGPCAIAGWDRGGRPRLYSADPLYTDLHRYYSHGTAVRHRLATDLDRGGSGEPVFHKGELVGIVDGLDSGDRAANVIAIDSISRLLDDLADGSYEGAPFVHLRVSPVGGDANLRAWLGLAEGEQGAYVSAARAPLRPGDIILQIDAQPIDDEGHYESPLYGRIHLQELLGLRHKVGETVPVQVLRNGRRLTVPLTLPPLTRERFLVDPLPSDSPPAYLVWGGLLFTELTEGYLRTWGAQWESRADRRLLHYRRYREMSSTPARRRVVVLVKVFATEENTGYHALQNRVVAACDGRPVRDLAHLREILAAATPDRPAAANEPAAAGGPDDPGEPAGADATLGQAAAEGAASTPGQVAAADGAGYAPGRAAAGELSTAAGLPGTGGSPPRFVAISLEGGESIVLERGQAREADRKTIRQYGVRRLTNLP